jgi:hypothetical protein
MVDLILAGREEDIAAELADGRINLEALLKEGDLDLFGW